MWCIYYFLTVLHSLAVGHRAVAVTPSLSVVKYTSVAFVFYHHTMRCIMMAY
jgi:hypothetical protein